jgi:PadR family transcriptional regulator, regulatory protein PadR
VGRTAWLWNQPDDSSELGRHSSGGNRSLYPALHRLERQGWVKAEWKKSESNQRAKFYKITKLGKEQLASDYERWGKMVATIEGIMTAK